MATIGTPAGMAIAAKALQHLRYSFQKVKNLSSDLETLSEEDLETWEGFVSRFSRASDIFINKYLETIILKEDPAFRGSVRDILNQAEKLQLIDSAEAWLEIRGLRNVTSHEYAEEKLQELFESVRKETPRLLEVEKKLK